MIRTVTLLLAGFFALTSTKVLADKRVALVIGNAAYNNAAPLKNPVNDARALTEALKRLGFEVLLAVDQDLATMRRSIRDFGQQLADADIGLFFYAGHAIQVNGANYLLPIDTMLTSETDLDFFVIDSRLVQRQMERGPATKVMILDSCRDNPFAGTLARSMGATRSAQLLGRGLAKIDAGGGSLIAFATDPGDVALDGSGRHSPFTEALLEHVETPGLEINVMLTRVRADVYTSTKSLQRPWTSSSLIGELYLAGEPEVKPGVSRVESTPAVQQSVETVFWQAAERGGRIADFEAYLERYPDGVFAALARNRLADITAGANTTQNVDRPNAQPDLSPVDADATLNLSRTQRREIQERLTLLGFNTWGIDGIFGRGTRNAIRRWQQKNNLDPSGYLNDEQVAKLEAQTSDKLNDGHRAPLPSSSSSHNAADGGSQTSLIYRATATCAVSSVRATATDTNRQQAMLSAARLCAKRGGSPKCCTSNVTVTP